MGFEATAFETLGFETGESGESSMGTVTISGTVYTIYGTRAAGDTYWQAMLGDTADAWASNTNKRDKALVGATLLLDRQNWLDTYSTFAIRNAYTNEDSRAVFQMAAYEIAGLLIIDPDFFTKEMSGSNVRRIDAGGGVGVSFFNPTVGITGRFPTNIQELIGKYLGSNAGASVSGSYSSGTDGTHSSAFGTTYPNDTFGLTKPNE